MSITRNDVARLAGVSPAVVSYVINNGPRPVSEGTRQKVLAVIEKTGYRPNLAARSLRLHRTQTIGIIVPDASNIFYSEILKDVEDITYEDVFGVILCSSNDDIKRQTCYIDNLVSRQVEGIIYVTLPVIKEELDILERYKIPAVYIMPQCKLDNETIERIRYISVDSEGGGYKIGKYLLQKGHTRLACITGKKPQIPDWDWPRQVGFMRAMAEAGLNPPIILTDEHPEGGYQSSYDLLNSSKRPTAIFACNDLLAIGTIRAANDLGLRVPGDLAVCGFDDIGFASFVSPRLTTVRIPRFEIAQYSMNMLMANFKKDRQTTNESGEYAYIRHKRFPTELIIRESA